jgi:hypothetical protein
MKMSNQPDTSPGLVWPENADEEMRYSQALWYAWGRQDAGQSHPLGDDAFRFAELRLAHYRAHRDEQTHVLHSMQDDFATWVTPA